jgi:hypothetical protein
LRDVAQFQWIKITDWAFFCSIRCRNVRIAACLAGYDASSIGISSCAAAAFWFSFAADAIN